MLIMPAVAHNVQSTHTDASLHSHGLCCQRGRSKSSLQKLKEFDNSFPNKNSSNLVYLLRVPILGWFCVVWHCEWRPLIPMSIANRKLKGVCNARSDILNGFSRECRKTYGGLINATNRLSGTHVLNMQYIVLVKRTMSYVVRSKSTDNPDGSPGFYRRLSLVRLLPFFMFFRLDLTRYMVKSWWQSKRKEKVAENSSIVLYPDFKMNQRPEWSRDHIVLSRIAKKRSHFMHTSALHMDSTKIYWRYLLLDLKYRYFCARNVVHVSRLLKKT